MKKVEISGVAIIHTTQRVSEGYANIEINGIKIENLLADQMLEAVGGNAEEYTRETAICRVTISIEPYTEMLVVNGQEMPLEL